MVHIPGGAKDFEKVKLDEWVIGVIEDIQEFKDVEKTYINDEGEKETRKINQVRFKFRLEEYAFAHYSKKMTASMNERSSLFLFLQQLYGDLLSPDIPVELDMLKGTKVKTMWSEVTLKNGNKFQYPDKVRSLEETLPAIWNVTPIEEQDAGYEGDPTPF